MPSNMPSLSDFMNSGQSGDFLDYVRRQNQGRQIPSNDPALAQMVARSGTIPVPAEAQSLQGPVSAPDPSQVRGPQALEMTDEQRKAYLAGGANFRGPMPMSAGQAQQAGAAAGEGASQTLQQNVPGLNMGVTGQQPGMQLPPGGYHQSIGGVRGSSAASTSERPIGSATTSAPARVSWVPRSSGTT